MEKSGRRSLEDQQRDKLVYRYLLTSLTDLGKGSKLEKSNEYSIAKQWGQENNRIYIRRVLRSVLTEDYDSQEIETTVPGLTVGKLVEILAGLEKYWQQKSSQVSPGKLPKTITRNDKLTALRKFIQLSSKEKEELKLPFHPGELLLKQLLELITDSVKGLQSQNIVSFYQNARVLYENLKKIELSNISNNFNSKEQTSSFANSQVSNPVKVTQLVENHIEKILKNLYQYSDEKLKRELVGKINRQINKFEFQSGIRQVNDVLKDKSDENQSLSDLFVYYLTSAIVENKFLNDEFPIYINNFEIEKIPTLPLYLDDQDRKKDRKKGLINPNLFTGEEEFDKQYEQNLKGLEKQSVQKVTVHFTVKLPENFEYSYRFGKKLSREISNFNHRQLDRDNQLDFTEEVIGIGSPITHIIAAINKVILWDIPLLKNYFPSAREIFIRDEVIGENSNSPVLSHTIIALCKKEDIKKAIDGDKQYDEVATEPQLSEGQYCGFDLIEVSAKAALYARLKAIKTIGIDAHNYLQQLCHKIEEKNALKKAESFVDSYPFSLKAMEGYLNQTIFKEPKLENIQNENFKSKYRSYDEKFNFSESQSNLEKWSLIAYDAHLKITDAYLREGLYRIAKKFIDALKDHIKEGFLDDDLLLAKYYFCQFRFYYLTDTEEKDFYDFYKMKERSPAAAVNLANEELKKAENCLTSCLHKFYVIGEASQTNFYSFFYSVSRMFAHQMKLYLFHGSATSSIQDERKGKRSSLRQAMYLLEKARIYAARDGNTANYSYWTSYQAWCYLITAYLEINEQFSKKSCIYWAKKLIDHAITCYSYKGEKLYQQIKNNGGKISEFTFPKEINNRDINSIKYGEKFDNMLIRVMPLVQEISTKKDQYDWEKHILSIDVSLLKERINSDGNKSMIYLFGTHSSMILFSMGMLELCDDCQENEIKGKIEKAMKIFVYCAAVAEEGGMHYQNLENSNLSIIDRIPPRGNNTNKLDVNDDEFDSWIKILYPHRLTQFVDLGRIFLLTCKTILLISESKYIDEYHRLKEELIDKLRENTTNNNSEAILGQERFNGQFDSHVQAIQRYFETIYNRRYELKTKTLKEIRDVIVRDIFKIIHGYPNVNPNF